jgi:rod shape-determining protein MreD
MSTTPPMIISSAGDSASSVRSLSWRPRMWAVALFVLAAVLLQVSLMPFIRIADGIPDAVVCVIVAVGLLRGSVVGSVAGAAAGMAVELAAPVGTLGVLALLYLVVGWASGRLCDRDEVRGVLPPVILSIIAEVFVQLGGAFVQLMFARPVDVGDFVRTVLASAILTALIAVPAVSVVRRVLGAPRAVEPFLIMRDG